MNNVIGSIYFHKEFEFQDGTIGEKLFVTVNSPSAQENYLVCRTTSREKPPYRLRRQGCDAKRNYFMFFSKDDLFKKDTWVQFDRIFEFTTEQMLQGKFGQSIGKIKGLFFKTRKYSIASDSPEWTEMTENQKRIRQNFLKIRTIESIFKKNRAFSYF